MNIQRAINVEPLVGFTLPGNVLSSSYIPLGSDAVLIGIASELQAVAAEENEIWGADPDLPESDERHVAWLNQARAASSRLEGLCVKLAGVSAASLDGVQAKADAILALPAFKDGVAFVNEEEHLTKSLALDVVRIGGQQRHPARLHPDAELLVLVSEGKRLLDQLHEDGERRDAAAQVRHRSMPKPPQALFRLDGDFTYFSGFQGHTHSDTGRLWYGSQEDLEIVRTAQFENMFTSEKQKQALRKRRFEILIANDTWQAEIAANDVATGYADASAAWDASLGAVWAMWPRVAACRATTLDGLMAKASLLCETPEDLQQMDHDIKADDTDTNSTGYSIVRDLAAMFHAKSPAEPEAVPADDRDLFDMFGKWMSATAEAKEIDRDLCALLEDEPKCPTRDRAEFAFDERLFDAWRKCKGIAREMMNTPANSWEGVRSKGLVFAECYSDEAGQSDLQTTMASLSKNGPTDELTAYSIARDIARLTVPASLRKPIDRVSRPSDQDSARAAA